MAKIIKEFFHSPTGSFSYVVGDDVSRKAAVIDPVLDYDPASGRTGRHHAEQIVNFVTGNGLEVKWLLETHAHADHISAADFLRSRLGGLTAIGEGIRQVQTTFKVIFNLNSEFSTDGSQFDRLLCDGDRLNLGEQEIIAWHTPGHTSDSVSYLVEDAVFVGDTLFSPANGTARVDFPGGDAATLYRSIQRLLALPETTRLYLCHDYPAEGEEPVCSVTVAEQKSANTHLGAGTTEDRFVTLRKERDRTLGMPQLILPAVQINIRGGAFPDPEDNGVSYLKIPLNTM